MTPASKPAPAPLSEPEALPSVTANLAHADASRGILEVVFLYEPPGWSVALPQRRVVARVTLPLAAGNTLLGQLQTALGARRAP